MRHAWYPRSLFAGFTLIELMIVLAVAAILALVAVPSYQDSVRKSRRADATAALTRMLQVQERYRSGAPQYASAVASAAAMPGASGASSEGHYTLTFANASATGYTINATANATSPQFGDTKCRTLRVTMDKGTIHYKSVDAAGTVDDTNANRCWVK
jgi:type IV pilus assembly protein PilE